MALDKQLSSELFHLSEHDELPIELASLLLDCSEYASGMFETDASYHSFNPSAAAREASRMLAALGA